MNFKRGNRRYLMSIYCLWINILIGFLLGTACAFRILKIRVPDKVLAGNSVKLGCEVDFGDQRLYSLTWWKDDKQFFQFSPNAVKPKVAYEISGINVDMDNSSMELVVVKNVSLQTSGEFKCELVAESPSFEKDFKTQNMTVVRIPDETPVLSTGRVSYSPGDILDANCTSPVARPPPDIEWLINNIAVSQTYSKIISKELPYLRLNSRTSRLRIPLREDHFWDGKALLSCSAYITNIYHKLSHSTLLKTGYRNVAPSQKYSGEGNISCGDFRALFLALWTPILIHLIKCP